MKDKKNNNCPFCQIETGWLADNPSAYAIRDGFPVSEGHSLIISKRHVTGFYQLTREEQSACWELVRTVKEELLKLYKPDGFNIGINIGEAAGQTVFHTHIHIIPRYTGDMENPRGGVRHAIPGMGDY